MAYKDQEKALTNTYFTRVQDQPYSYFQEESFRRKLASESSPKFLVFAAISSALRFADLDFYRGAVQEAQAAYAKEACLSVLNDHMTAENKLAKYPRISDNKNLSNHRFYM